MEWDADVNISGACIAFANLRAWERVSRKGAEWREDGEQSKDGERHKEMQSMRTKCFRGKVHVAEEMDTPFTCRTQN